MRDVQDDRTTIKSASANTSLEAIHGDSSLSGILCHPIAKSDCLRKTSMRHYDIPSHPHLMTTTTRRPCIGVFDSGFGGLTVLKELVALAPEADYLYFGDTARLPYGSKSAETVARYAIGAAQYLEQHGAQMLVIACNTATALALDRITQASSVPVVGVDRAWRCARRRGQPDSQSGGHRHRGNGEQPCLRQGVAGSRHRGHGKGLPAVCAVGRRRLGGTPGRRTSSPDLSRPGFRRRLRVSRCPGAGLHPLSSAEAACCIVWCPATSPSSIPPTPRPAWSASYSVKACPNSLPKPSAAECLG